VLLVKLGFVSAVLQAALVVIELKAYSSFGCIGS